MVEHIFVVGSGVLSTLLSWKKSPGLTIKLLYPPCMEGITLILVPELDIGEDSRITPAAKQLIRREVDYEPSWFIMPLLIKQYAPSETVIDCGKVYCMVKDISLLAKHMKDFESLISIEYESTLR
jgi:hypothetical protein